MFVKLRLREGGDLQEGPAAATLTPAALSPERLLSWGQFERQQTEENPLVIRQ